MIPENDNSTLNYDFPKDGFSYIRLIYESKLGFTRLFKAKRMGKWHILKTLKTEYANDPDAIQLLKREFEVSYPLSYPNIVQTVNLENVKGVGLAIVMEYIEGRSLREYIQGKLLDRDMIYRITAELSQALIYLHGKNVVHRDLKPENIIITAEGQHAVLIDFGYSDPRNYAVLKHRAGTRKYAAPEHLLDDGVVDNQTDIYSLGVILKEMNETLAVPSYWLRRISLRCREYDKEKRYASAEELLQALENRDKRNRMVALAIVAAVVLVLAVVAGSVYNRQPSSGAAAPDTTQELEDSIKANPATRQAGESYQRLADLLMHSKKLTLEMLDENAAMQKDTTIPLSRRNEAENNLFFRVEDAVKNEVNKTIAPEDPQYSIYLNATLSVMEQTFKDYNANKDKDIEK